jgi:acetylornithine deacetylase/succinyl-diaminopimelate desuccinylase-like protein
MNSKDGRICAGIWSEHHLTKTFHDLMALGPRLLGSPGEKRAQEFLADRLRSWGLAVSFQKFPVQTYLRGDARAAVTVNRDTINLTCEAFAFAPATSAPLGLDLVDAGLGDPGDVERLKGDLEGCAAYCRPDDEMRSRRHARLTEAGAKACVFGSHLDHDGCIISMVRKTKAPSVPAIGLNHEATVLLESAMARGDARVTLEVSGETVPSASGNLVAVVPGRSDLPQIVVGGHLDTFDISEGALDNGAGVALICELARLFALIPAPLRTVRFVLFTGEEVSCTGSRRYVEDYVKDPKSVGLFFNVDMPVEGGVPGILTSGWKTGNGYWKSLADELGHPFPVAEVPPRYSDHAPFAALGVPCLWTRAFRTGMRGPAAIEHTSLDTADKVDMLELKEAAMLTGRILLSLADAPSLPVCHQPPSSAS